MVELFVVNERSKWKSGGIVSRSLQVVKGNLCQLDLIFSRVTPMGGGIRANVIIHLAAKIASKP